MNGATLQKSAKNEVVLHPSIDTRLGDHPIKIELVARERAAKVDEMRGREERILRQDYEYSLSAGFFNGCKLCASKHFHTKTCSGNRAFLSLNLSLPCYSPPTLSLLSLYQLKSIELFFSAFGVDVSLPQLLPFETIATRSFFVDQMEKKVSSSKSKTDIACLCSLSTSNTTSDVYLWHVPSSWYEKAYWNEYKVSAAGLNLGTIMPNCQDGSRQQWQRGRGEYRDGAAGLLVVVAKPLPAPVFRPFLCDFVLFSKITLPSRQKNTYLSQKHRDGTDIIKRVFFSLAVPNGEERRGGGQRTKKRECGKGMGMMPWKAGKWVHGIIVRKWMIQFAAVCCSEISLLVCWNLDGKNAREQEARWVVRWNGWCMVRRRD